MNFNNTQRLLAGMLAVALFAGMGSAAYATEGPPPDNDNDQVPDSIDLCDPTPPNQGPSDGDGCTDLDGDGVKGFVDLCLETPPAATVDADGCEIPVAGELLSLSSSALVIGGLASSAVWMIPAIAGIAGAGIYLVKTRSSRD